MDPQVAPSFIPKKPLTADGRAPGQGPGLLFLIALLVFIAAVTAAGGAFAYDQYLKRTIENKSGQLAVAEGAFDLPTIQDLIRTDARIKNAKTLLAKHVAPSALFSFLSTQTLINVQFTSFDYTLGADGSSQVTLSGTADTFSTVALQSDQLGASKVLKDVIFSGITVDPQNGKVNFSVSATADPSLLLYSKSLVMAGGAAQ